MVSPGGALVVHPAFERFDAVAAPAFRQALLPRVAGQALVILNLEQVAFMDSSGLSTLLSLLKALPAGGEVRLAHVHKDVGVLLKLTRLGSIFPAWRDVETALAGQPEGRTC